MAERPNNSEKAGSLPDLEVWLVSTSALRTPAYRHHKPSNQAVVTLDGRDIYLGRYGSPQSRAEFDRLLAEWLANGRRLPVPVVGSDLTVNELVLAYLGHADTYYVKNGKLTVEPGNIRLAVRPLRRLYGHTQAREFGPVALKAVRAAMVEGDICRSEINRRIGRIVRIFKWAVSEELVPPSVHQALQTVPGLRRGRADVRESEPVKPVADLFVDAIKPYVSHQVWAMVELQRLSGMRPGEVCMMRSCDLDTSSRVWTYTPESHKTYSGPPALGLPGDPRSGRRDESRYDPPDPWTGRQGVDRSSGIANRRTTGDNPNLHEGRGLRRHGVCGFA